MPSRGGDSPPLQENHLLRASPPACQAVYGVSDDGLPSDSTVGPFDRTSCIPRPVLHRKEEVVISGISGRYPDCDNITEFWEKLVSGVEFGSIDERRWPVGYHGLPPRAGKLSDISHCDFEFFGLTEQEANFMDVQMRIALETTYEAVCDAGLDPASLRGSRTGLFAGICYDDTGTAYRDDESTAQSYMRISIQRLASVFDLKGCACVVDTACASSFSAFCQAYNSLKAGVCDQAIVLGVGVNLRPTIALGFANIRMTSQDGRSKCLDASADGYGRSEAVVSILLQRKSQAKRVYASIVASQTNTDGFKSEGITYPSIESQHRLMKSTQEKAGIHPHDIKYVEAHMTGTPAGDVVESESIRQTFCSEGRKDPLLLGCLKSNLGHTEGASGTCALSKVCLVFENKTLPPNLHFNDPNPNITGLKTGELKPVTQRMPFNEQVVGVSSFGFGGCNVFSILKANDKEPSKRSFQDAFPSDLPRLVPVCGRSDEAVEHIFDFIDRNKQNMTNDFFGLLNQVMKTEVDTGMATRGYCVFEKKGDTISMTKKAIETCPESKGVWLAMSGICNEWTCLPVELLKLESFSQSIMISALVAENMGIDLKKVLFGSDSILLHEAVVGTVATQMAFIDLFASLDLKVQGFIGHSIGEITCGYADGCLTRQQALWTAFLVAKQFMAVSDHNGLERYSTSRMTNMYPLMKKVLEEAVFRNKPRKRSSRWVSTCDSYDEYITPDFFANVFAQKNESLKKLGSLPKKIVVVEVASEPILQETLRQKLDSDSRVESVLSENGLHDMLELLGSLYMSGANLSFEKLYPRVEYPVCKGTPSISSLIKWQHSKSLNVTLYPDYFAVTQGIHSYDIDLMQSSFQYLSGHIIDSRNLCPAVEYLRYVWEIVVVNVFDQRDYLKYPIEFKKVRLVRGILLNRSKAVQVVVKYQKETGAFETYEGGNLCCSGYAFIPTDPDTTKTERILTESKTESQLLDSKSIYKELRVRGYDYGNTFQGLVDASADASHGRVKWMGQWVSFVDSMLQMAILGLEDRNLKIPTFLEYLKCDAKTFFKNIEDSKDEMGESLVDVYYDKDLCLGSARGLVMLGLKTSQIQRRNTQQPVLEKYCFTPYIESDVELEEHIVREIDSYRTKCMTMINMLKRRDTLEDEEKLKKEVEEMKRDPSNALLTVLFDTLNETENNRDSLLNEILLEKLKQVDLASDTLSCSALNSEIMTRHHIDILLENLIGRDVKVLELNSTSGLLSDKISQVLDANLLQTSYTVIHSEPASSLKNMANGVNLMQLKGSNSIPSDVTDLDLIVVRDESCMVQPLGSSKEDRSLSLMAMDRLLDESNRVLKNNGFLLIFSRNHSQDDVERQLQSIINVTPFSNQLFTEDETILLSQAQEKGFQVISVKKENCLNMSSVLLRKKNADQSNIKVIPVSNSCFEWVEEVKAFFADEEKKNHRLWLTCKESNSGIVGLVNCLRREPGCENVRCYFNCDSEEIPNIVLEKDLVMNVVNGKMGSFRHSLLPDEHSLTETTHAYVDMKTKGDLSSFRWFENNTKFSDSFSTNLVNICYSSLNFKDVMISSGRISSDAYPSGMGVNGSLLGMEFSGMDMNGNYIMGYSIGKGIATSIEVPHPLFLWSVPVNWSLEEAATVPVVYATVYYGLIVRGSLCRGETVLIHSGAGGVGQAAINVCQSMGCKVLTTCSDSKRDFLKETFHLKDNQILNSRDISFEEAILRETGGRGVDVILNSLSETKLFASVNCLAEHGRFVEIGKYDIMTDSTMNMNQFQENKSFQTVCLAHLDVDAFFNRNPSAFHIREQVYNLVKEGIETGVVKPLKRHVFERSQIEEAFRFMATGKHIGKVLIRIRDNEQEEVTLNAIKQTLLNPTKTYIIVGGLGGFGLELALWLTSRGAKNIVLSSRRGIKDKYQEFFLNRFVGAKVMISTDDITNREGVVSLLSSCPSPVGGIFNLAMVLKDATIANQTIECFKECCEPKATATVLLDEVSREMCPGLEHFVCFSSVVSGRGNGGQTNYGFANSVMEMICLRRRRDKLPGLAIQWGAIGDVGVVAEVLGGNDVVIGGTSVPQRLPSCLETLDQLMQSNETVVSSVVRVNLNNKNNHAKGDLLGTVCHILGIKDPSSLDPNSTLSELGLDSLMAIEIKQGLEREYDLVLTTQEIRNIKVKDLKAMEANIKTDSKKEKEISCQVTVEQVCEMPKSNFIRLNHVETGKPIFCFCPFEGSLGILTSVVKHMSRPVIGVNWTEDVEKIGALKDVVNYFLHIIQQTYPDSVYDFIGYDFGGLLALEAAAQLHNKNEVLCTKVCLIESSPDLIKSFSTDLLAKSYDSLLVQYFSLFFNIEQMERRNLEKDLNQFNSKDEKLKFMCSQFDKKISEETKDASQSDSSSCDPIRLGEAVDRFQRKLVFSSNFILSRKNLKVMLGLQRSSDSLNGASLLDNSYNLSKIQDASQDLRVQVLEGDHRSMLSFHAESIGHSLDSFFLNISA